MTTGLTAAKTAAALLDRSAWGCIAVKDADRLRFLHNQTTNDLQSLQPGEGCSTVFVTSTARTMDRVSAYVCEDDVLLTSSPGMADSLLEWMDRYIFFADKVTPKNMTEETFVISVIGPNAQTVLLSLVEGDLPQQPFAHRQASLAGVTVTLAADSTLALPGFTLVGAKAYAAEVLAALDNLPTLTQADWDYLRIEQGYPLPEQELTTDDNPLEAGLWSAVSFNKGCYIGQETIARLNTYKGVKKRLWRLGLSEPVAPVSELTLDGEKVGEVRSVATLPGEETVGLGYVRTKAGGEGLVLQAGAATAKVLSAPYLSHTYFESGENQTGPTNQA